MSKNKEFIIILDGSTGQVFITEYNNNIVENPEDYFDIINEEYNLDLKEGECSWQITKKKVEINYI